MSMPQPTPANPYQYTPFATIGSGSQGGTTTATSPGGVTSNQYFYPGGNPGGVPIALPGQNPMPPINFLGPPTVAPPSQGGSQSSGSGVVQGGPYSNPSQWSAAQLHHHNMTAPAPVAPAPTPAPPPAFVPPPSSPGAGGLFSSLSALFSQLL